MGRARLVSRLGPGRDHRAWDAASRRHLSREIHTQGQGAAVERGLAGGSLP